MSDSIVSSLDEKGRVLIPLSLRERVGLASGEKVLVSADPASKTLIIEPSHEKELLSLTIELGDQPGALAKAALALYDLGVDLVSTHSRSARRGEVALWEVECNPRDASIAQIKAALLKCGAKLAASQWQ
ncbi:Uncharacterised protein [uncultured archaeon]|nr:Uncharacterised protein [uncultured archaeon]